MADLSEIAKNAKKIKEQIAQQSGVSSKEINDDSLKEAGKILEGSQKVVDQGQDPTKVDPVQLKALSGDDKPKEHSAEELSNQKKIAYVLATIAPTLLGYSFGGNEGGAIGAKASGDFISAVGKQDEESRKDAREFAQKKELKAGDLAAKAEENKLRHEEKLSDQEIKKLMVQSNLDQKNQKANDAKSVDGRLAKLNSGDKARLDNSKLGLEYTQQMDKALAGGEDTFKLIGDNKFTNALSLAAEAFGRMQSGGAINKEEEARFIKMAPTKTDNAAMQRLKLQNMQKLYVDRLGTLGFKPEELGLTVEPITYGAPKQAAAGGVKNPALPNAEANQAPDFDNMSEEDLKKYLGH